jgi:hypothetical protein
MIDKVSPLIWGGLGDHLLGLIWAWLNAEKLLCDLGLVYLVSHCRVQAGLAMVYLMFG